jgi:hypothetical protein
MKFDLKTWVGFNILCDVVIVVLLHSVMKPLNEQGTQFIHTFTMYAILGIAVITSILFNFMNWDYRCYQKRKESSGEATPYYTKDYPTGNVIAYRNTVKIIHGNQCVRVDVNEFLKLAQEIKWKHNNILVENPNDTNI